MRMEQTNMENIKVHYSINQVNEILDTLIATVGTTELLDSLIYILDADTRDRALTKLQKSYNIPPTIK